MNKDIKKFFDSNNEEKEYMKSVIKMIYDISEKLIVRITKLQSEFSIGTPFIFYGIVSCSYDFHRIILRSVRRIWISYWLH